VIPRRVARSRKKGSRLPANTVCVSRPSPWGNPFVVKFGRPADACVALYREFVEKDPSTLARWMRENVGALRGKNLACWCPEGTACHADVLLELANRNPAAETLDRAREAWNASPGHGHYHGENR
jgi:hypothetical protein